MNEDKTAENGNGLNILAEHGLIDIQEEERDLFVDSILEETEQFCSSAPVFVTSEMKEDFKTVMKILTTAIQELDNTKLGRETATIIGGVATLFLVNPPLLPVVSMMLLDLCRRK